MLRQVDCIKRIIADEGGTLEADSGESFLVKAIFVLPSDADDFLTVKIDNFTVGYYRLVGKSGNHLGGIQHTIAGFNLMDYLVKRGLPFSLPIAAGQKLNVSRADEAGDIQILYDKYDAGDVRADMPCGTDSKIYGFLQYLRETDVLTASGDMELNKSLTPAEFPDFPAGRACPSNTTIKLHGIAGAGHNEGGVGDGKIYSSFLKLVKEREVLFDEDRNGIPFSGDPDGSSYDPDYRESRSIIGSAAEFAEIATWTAGRPPLMFDTPLEFVSGEELLVYLTCVLGSTATMTANYADVALILEVVKG